MSCDRSYSLQVSKFFSSIKSSRLKKVHIFVNCALEIIKFLFEDSIHISFNVIILELYACVGVYHLS